MDRTVHSRNRTKINLGRSGSYIFKRNDPRLIGVPCRHGNWSGFGLAAYVQTGRWEDMITHGRRGDGAMGRHGHARRLRQGDHVFAELGNEGLALTHTNSSRPPRRRIRPARDVGSFSTGGWGGQKPPVGDRKHDVLGWCVHQEGERESARARVSGDWRCVEEGVESAPESLGTSGLPSPPPFPPPA